MTNPTDVKPNDPAQATPPVPPKQPDPAAATPPADAKDAPKKDAKPETSAPLLATDDPAEGSAAPENYEFKAPEGETYDPTTLALYEVIARDLGLPQDKAQTTLDRVVPAIKDKLAAANADRLQQMADEVRAHPTLGGANLKATLADAKLVLDRLGNPRLRELLRDPVLGVGSDVGLVEFLASIRRRFMRGDDQLLREDRRNTQQSSDALSDADEIAARYPKMAARMSRSS